MRRGGDLPEVPAQGEFVGSYLEPSDVLSGDVDELFGFVREEVKIANLFFRGYSFIPERPGLAGGTWFTPHPEYYEGTTLTDFKADYEGDLLQKVVDAARRQKVNVYFYMFPSKRAPLHVPGYSMVREVDESGQPHYLPCFGGRFPQSTCARR